MDRKYFLTLRVQKGREAKIDLSLLEGARGFNSTDLRIIDQFTLNFTYNELMQEIIKANIADAYLTGELCITDNQNHRPLKVLTKDYVKDFNIFKYINENINNKKIMNNIVNKFHNYSEEKMYNTFKTAVKEENRDVIFTLLNNLEYLDLRKLLCYLIETV